VLLYVIFGALDEPPARRNVAIGFSLFFGSVLNGAAVGFLRRRDVQYKDAANDAGATLRFCRPRRDAVTLFICCLFAAVGCVFLLFTDVPWFLSSFLLLGFGGMAVAGLFTMSRRQPRSLTLSLAGLDYSPFGTGPIAWRDIQRARMSGGRTTVITLKLVDEAKYLRAGKKPFWAWGNRLTLRTSFAFIPTALDASPRLIMHAIETRLSKFGRPDHATLAKTV
jgi:hypothetical protein